MRARVGECEVEVCGDVRKCAVYVLVALGLYCYAVLQQGRQQQRPQAGTTDALVLQPAVAGSRSGSGG